MMMMYKNFLRDSERDNKHQSKMRRRMGYISNVNDAKEILEKIYKDNKTNKS